ncbi:Trk system potassium transporter TrkA [Ruminococcus sp. OM05-10BH]|uniref:Trk system potassium uptake protein TrkA n=1 Tax=Sellimonas catena TaxID=2994035 RepID=A0A9W6CG10_9FIRM|nr:MULTISPECIES: Trk system potassium transporter TrkA [Clostridia]OUN67751.1 Trk system potassium transport protein TrkA [Drancourtella sp. An57]RHV30941.1 Trk system potassium transporter TrkA [Ruminococcus sp. OM05-10BH]GLG91000.1 potassium transporter peripheral membrane protein [Sellimonas catena]
MNIIIVGAGKVGTTIADQLSSENHNITIIDLNQKKVEEAEEEFDAMGIVGNGASHQVQVEAGVMDAELLIAVTGSDELNLLCCLIAKKTGKCQTIARVRNPIYSKEVNFIKRQMGLSAVINPELTAAQEISQLLRLPYAKKVDTFARGRVEMIKFRMNPELHMDGLQVADIISKMKCDIMICGVERQGQVVIPNGDFVLKNNDLVSMMAVPKETAKFFRKMGIPTHQAKSTLIVGGGTIAYYLAKQLLEMRVDVRIIEQNKERCEMLSEQLPEATILQGDGTDKEFLLEEGLMHTDSFVALTNMDEENLMLALLARKYSNAKLIAKVNRIHFEEVVDELDIDSVIYPKNLAADHIVRYTRAMQNSLGSNVETLYKILDGQAEALEFVIREDSSVTNQRLMDLPLKDHLLVCYISRYGKLKMARGQDMLKVGDSVIIVTTHKGLHDITDILKY